MIADAMGCYCFRLSDVSVDGLHRVLQNIDAVRTPPWDHQHIPPTPPWDQQHQPEEQLCVGMHRARVFSLSGSPRHDAEYWITLLCCPASIEPGACHQGNRAC